MERKGFEPDFRIEHSIRITGWNGVIYNFEFFITCKAGWVIVIISDRRQAASRMDNPRKAQQGGLSEFSPPKKLGRHR